MDSFLGSVPDRRGTSLMRAKEVDAITGILRSRLLSSTTLLEIGTYEGVTASLIAERCPNCVVTSIDPFIDHDEKDTGRRSGAERIGNFRHNMRPNQRLYVGTLADFHAISQHDFDAVLVDGWHHYEGVLSDLRYASTMLLPDSAVFVHDYQDPQWEEVTAAVDTFLDSAPFRIERIVESLAILRRKS